MRFTDYKGFALRSFAPLVVSVPKMILNIFVRSNYDFF